MSRSSERKTRKSSSTVDLREMDKLHETMVRKLEEAEEEDYKDAPIRKSSVSISCQTDKVSRRVSHSAALTSIPGHELTPVTRTVRSSVSHRAGDLVLKECNNSLVAFIDKARVLAEANELQVSLPNKLSEKVSVQVNVTTEFEDEIEKLKKKLEQSRTLALMRSKELESHKKENTELVQQHQENQRLLSMVQKELFSLEAAEQELEMKIGNMNMRLQERITELELEIKAVEDNVRQAAANFPELEETKDNQYFAPQEEELDMRKLMGEITGDKSEEEKAVIIKIKNEFLLKMKKKLHEVRLEYQEDYQKFIAKVEGESAEIMQFYEALIAARMPKTAAALHSSALLELEKIRNYQGRISQLREDTQRLVGDVARKEGDAEDRQLEYKDKLNILDMRLDELKKSLSDLFKEFAEFTKWKYGNSHEITIYSRLLQFEKSRLEERKETKQVSVSQRTEKTKRTSKYPTDGYHERQEKSERKPRRESGYKSSGEKTPEGTLERGYSLNSRDSFLADLESSV